MKKKSIVASLLLIGLLASCDDDLEDNPLQETLDELSENIYSVYEEGKINYPNTLTYLRKQEGTRTGKSFDAEYEIRVDGTSYAYLGNVYPATSNPYLEEENDDAGLVSEQDYYFCRDNTYYLTTYRNFSVDDDDTSTGQTTLTNYRYADQEDDNGNVIYSASNQFVDAVTSIYQMGIDRANSCFNYLETIIDYGYEFYDASIEVNKDEEGGILTVEANNIPSYLDDVSIYCSYILQFEIETILPLSFSATILNAETLYATSDKYIYMEITSSFDWSTPEHLEAPGQEISV